MCTDRTKRQDRKTERKIRQALIKNKGSVAGFLPTTESNFRTAMGIEM